jgi:hypothetical protein
MFDILPLSLEPFYFFSSYASETSLVFRQLTKHWDHGKVKTLRIAPINREFFKSIESI